jgi:hypothetical protein
MVALDVTHGRRLSRCNFPERPKVMLNPAVIEPFWVEGGCHLEQMLI